VVAASVAAAAVAAVAVVGAGNRILCDHKRHSLFERVPFLLYESGTPVLNASFIPSFLVIRGCLS